VDRGTWLWERSRADNEKKRRRKIETKKIPLRNSVTKSTYFRMQTDTLLNGLAKDSIPLASLNTGGWIATRKAANKSELYSGQSAHAERIFRDIDEGRIEPANGQWS
jgi:hypothetical protein